MSNALLALGLAVEWDVDPVEAIAALAKVELPGMRMDVRRMGDARVIVDCYNANPASMRAAGDLLASMPRGSARVAIMGSMRELGDESAKLHRESLEEMLAWESVKESLRGDEVVLLKGSRGVALERLLPLLEDAFGVHHRSSAGGNRGRRDDAGGASEGNAAATGAERNG